MRELVIDLYVGIPADTGEEVTDRFVEFLNERHPDSVLVTVGDGYWSGVNEKTYQIQVKCTLEKAQATAQIIKEKFDNWFVAIEETDN